MRVCGYCCCCADAVQLEDNKLAIGILWSVFIAMVIEILITGPLVILITHAFLPYFAASVTEKDIHFAFDESQHEVRRSLERAGSGTFEANLDDEHRYAVIRRNPNYRRVSHVFDIMDGGNSGGGEEGAPPASRGSRTGPSEVEL